MAGDWIKMRVDLADDPAVIGMSSYLKMDEYEIIGRLHKLWSWADKHSASGFVPHITQKWIDKYLEKPGFSSQMIVVGWIYFDNNGVTFPNFDRHNGKSAKSRAENTERARLSRKERDENALSSAQMSQKKCDKNVTREEKRREEGKPPYLANEEYLGEVEGTHGAVEKNTAGVDPETGEVISWAA